MKSEELIEIGIYVLLFYVLFTLFKKCQSRNVMEGMEPSPSLECPENFTEPKEDWFGNIESSCYQHTEQGEEVCQKHYMDLTTDTTYLYSIFNPDQPQYSKCVWDTECPRYTGCKGADCLTSCCMSDAALNHGDKWDFQSEKYNGNTCTLQSDPVHMKCLVTNYDGPTCTPRKCAGGKVKNETKCANIDKDKCNKTISTIAVDDGPTGTVKSPHECKLIGDKCVPGELCTPAPAVAPAPAPATGASDGIIDSALDWMRHHI